jgi:hypothetical protein
MLHDRPFHLAQRWLTYRRRQAVGDLFLGRYGVQTPLLEVFATAFQAGSPKIVHSMTRMSHFLPARHQMMLSELREA